MAGGCGVPSLPRIATLACLVFVPGALAQETPDRLSFPAQASAITVDVVVLDDDGQPVRGLTRDEFTVLEDGREQVVVGFEARDIDLHADAIAQPSGGAFSQVATDNSGPAASPGRVFALLIDDLGISSAVGTQLKPILAEWIRGRTDPRDEITIMTTSGDLWWSDLVGRGRSDLLTVLGRVGGKRLNDPRASEGMSVWEAYQITSVQRSAVLAERREIVRLGAGYKIIGANIVDRVLERWLATGRCEPIPGDPLFEVCVSAIQQAANSLHDTWRQRAEAVYGAVGRLSRSLTAVPGRKSILLVSEDFIQDSSVDRPFRDAIDASQRANTAVYFLAARGLAGMSTFSAALNVAPRPQDIGMLGAEEGTLSTGGAEMLADATGGAITISNDLAEGLERMALDSTAYYLLGYQPEDAPDGKWHQLQVVVNRPDVRILARKGYMAAPLEGRAQARQEQATAKADDGERRSKRALAPALLAGSARGSLPLRLAAYIRDNDGVSKARIQVVVEIDNSRVRIDHGPTPWRATLDLTILAAALDRAPLVPFDERLHLSLSPGDVAAGWWLVPREVWLPPGVTQLRVFVRDVPSGLSGLATLRIVVPDMAEPYLSTPLLTDRALPASKPGERPGLVPTGLRQFEGRGPLYCEYEVFTFGGQGLRGVPQLLGSYLLQGPDGRVISSDRPTLIQTEGDRAVRRLVLPAEKLAEGPYVLAITVEDRLARRTLVAYVPFVIGRDNGVHATPPQ